MAATEGAQEGLTLWQNVGGAVAVFIAVGTGILSRFLAKKGDVATAGDSGKHVVLEQATLADAGPFMQMGKDVAAIRSLLEDQVELQRQERERRERDKIKEQLDEADADRREMKRMMQALIDKGAEHKPGRPLRDA